MILLVRPTTHSSYLGKSIHTLQGNAEKLLRFSVLILFMYYTLLVEELAIFEVLKTMRSLVYI